MPHISGTETKLTNPIRLGFKQAAPLEAGGGTDGPALPADHEEGGAGG